MHGFIYSGIVVVSFSLILKTPWVVKAASELYRSVFPSPIEGVTGR